MPKKSSTTRRRRLVAPTAFFPIWDVGSLAGFKSVRDELVRRQVPPDLITAIADALDPGPVGGELGQQIRDLEVQLRALREAHARGEPVTFDLQDLLRRIRRAIWNDSIQQLPRVVMHGVQRGSLLDGTERKEHVLVQLVELRERFGRLSPSADVGRAYQDAVDHWDTTERCRSFFGCWIV